MTGQHRAAVAGAKAGGVAGRGRAGEIDYHTVVRSQFGCETRRQYGLSALDAADPTLLRERVDATLAAATADDHRANKEVCGSDARAFALATARRSPTHTLGGAARRASEA